MSLRRPRAGAQGPRRLEQRHDPAAVVGGAGRHRHRVVVGRRAARRARYRGPGSRATTLCTVPATRPLRADTTPATCRCGARRSASSRATRCARTRAAAAEPMGCGSAAIHAQHGQGTGGGELRRRRVGGPRPGCPERQHAHGDQGGDEARDDPGQEVLLHARSSGDAAGRRGRPQVEDSRGALVCKRASPGTRLPAGVAGAAELDPGRRRQRPFASAHGPAYHRNPVALGGEPAVPCTRNPLQRG